MERSHKWYLGQQIPKGGILHLGAAGQERARQSKGGECAVGPYQRVGLQRWKRKLKEWSWCFESGLDSSDPCGLEWTETRFTLVNIWAGIILEFSQTHEWQNQVQRENSTWIESFMNLLLKQRMPLGREVPESILIWGRVPGGLWWVWCSSQCHTVPLDPEPMQLWSLLMAHELIIWHQLQWFLSKSSAHNIATVFVSHRPWPLCCLHRPFWVWSLWCCRQRLMESTWHCRFPKHLWNVYGIVRAILKDGLQETRAREQESQEI